ncbi:hypothetical protein DV738_g3234, partial [Chaetothyriales sp. CBS 135597]
MDQHQRPDTLSSGRFPEQWAFLSNPPALSASAARSLPTSSYIRSDGSSSISRLPATANNTGFGFGFGGFGLASLHDRNGSRSSLPPRNNIQPGSVGAHSSATTLPTQPVLLCINADAASRHLHPAPRQPTQRPIMSSKAGELPSLQEYSFDGILATISEDVEEDFTAIGDILGRSRFVLADQHDSHLPPTGEIRASPLQAVAEASASNERLAADQVIIANDEASLIDGSHSGSAAYGLLERLQALHPTTPLATTTTSPTPHMTRELRTSASGPSRSSARPLIHSLLNRSTTPAPTLDSHPHPHRRTTQPVVSEIYLSAGAGGRIFSDPPVVSEGGRFYPLYSYDEKKG